jgi:hypothetical protein
MNPSSHLHFQPLHNATALIGNDHNALAHQLHLCRTERSGWHLLRSLAAGAQAFAASHLISVLMLVVAIASAISWLMG